MIIKDELGQVYATVDIYPENRDYLSIEFPHARGRVVIDRRVAVDFALAFMERALPKNLKLDDPIYYKLNAHTLIPAKITGFVEGWVEVAFKDGSSTIVRPSRIYMVNENTNED